MRLLLKSLIVIDDYKAEAIICFVWSMVVIVEAAAKFKEL